MDRPSTIKLLDETFNQNFELERFVKFVKELFNKFTVTLKSWDVWKEYNDYIESYQLLGSFKDTSKKTIDVLVVKLKRASSRDRARIMQRNFVAKYLGNTQKDAALVAFYGDDPEDWRFSFVKMEYNLVKDESGKVKPVKELTPAKRYSFLVGVNEPNHTCRSQFLKLVMEEEVNPSFSEIEQAFSIDKVTKEFFEKYKELLLRLKESLEKVLKKDKNLQKEFEEKNISTVDFSKKLLGQIVFIYFLQKKGWLGVQKSPKEGFAKWGTGPKNFLRRLFDKEIVTYDNFFNEILEPLFYEALATERDDDYYSRFNCKIPFLNGGLFEPINDYDWAETDIVLDNSIFERIFSTFDRFNFTVKEDEPLEKKVAVDPEMLGKVFENLLEIKDRKSKGAFYTPREIVHYMCQQSLINYLETNTSISRKDIEKFIQMGDIALDQTIKAQEQKKKYYGKTFDIDENLIIPKDIEKNHEKIDVLLKKIKIVDPACGSGAFLIGMLNEIVKAKSILAIFSNKDQNIYDEKREIIENCLYGVDIESSAVDITKLRFWLSLVVDELDMRNIRPLPNLDHKIMCGNSLLEEFEGIRLFDDKLLGQLEKDYSFEIMHIDNKIADLYKEKGEIIRGKNKRKTVKEVDKEISKLERKKKKILSGPKDNFRNLTLDEVMQKRIKESKKKLSELKKLQKQLFNEQNRKIKKKLKEDIDKIEWELIEETLKEQGNLEAMQKLEEYKKNKAKPFFLWKLYFAEVFQRENPGFDIVITNPPYVGEDSHKDMFRPIAKGNLNQFYLGKMDIFYFFFHLSLNIGRFFSQIAFITTNYYPTAFGAEKLRANFKNRAIIRNLINFFELKIFESAKGQHNMITLLTKGKDDSFVANNCETSREGLANHDLLKSILSWSDKETTYYAVKQKDLYEGIKNYIRLMGSGLDSKTPIHRALNKIKSKSSNQLNYYCDVNQGVISGCDKLSKNLLKKISNKKEINLGQGIFIFDTKNIYDIDTIKTFELSEKKLLKKFYKNSEIGRYYCNIEPSKFLLYLDTKVTSLDKYPNIKNYLDKFREILKDRREVTLNRIKYYQLQWPRKENIFYEQKLVVPYRSDINSFAYNEVEWFCRSDCYVITKKKDLNLKYLLAILNSKLYYIWLYFKGKRKGKILELFQTPLSEIPIKKLPQERQKPFIKLVDQILSITKEDNYLDNSDKQAKVKRLEKEIDNLVYNLYELTPKEIKIIEEFNEKR